MLENIAPPGENPQPFFRFEIQPLSKLRGSRGDEAQTEENMEPPHVGCYSFDVARCAMGSFCSVSPGEISWPLRQHSKTAMVVGSSGESLASGTSSLGRCETNVG